MSFHIYTNNPNNYVRIHKSECTRCNFGVGVQNEILNGLNGNWQGPYLTYNEAWNNANNVAVLLPRMNTQILNCAFCNPQG